jgi:phenylacetate-CoA ligase
MLFEEDKKLLVARFGIPVVNEYGASEVDLIAFENPNNEWILNTETIFVEIVDENNKPLPFGETGKILITSLYNFAHPFIRYEVGDMGSISKKSNAKKMILEKLLGRTNDVAILPSGKRSPGMTFYSITKQLFADEGNVKEFVIKQTKIDTFEIIYVANNTFTSQEKEKITSVFNTYLEPNLTYIFIKKEKIERTSSGKLKQFVSLVDHNKP